MRRETREGLAIGIVLAFVVELVPRLTANTTVGLTVAIRGMDEPELRHQLATNGPVVIQNATTALLFCTFLVSQRLRVGPQRDSDVDAWLWFAALALGALADGVVTANTRGPWRGGVQVGFVVVQAMRALALGCASIRSSVGQLWVAAAGGVCGAAAVLGSTAGHTLGFEASSLIATPLLLVAALLLVVCMGRRLSGAPGHGAARALIGFGLELGVSRLAGANLL